MIVDCAGRVKLSHMLCIKGQTMTNEEKQTLQTVFEQLNGLVYDIENYNDLDHLGETIIDCVKRLEKLGVNNDK